MKNMKNNIIKIMALSAFAAVMVSCTDDFIDKNTNKEQATDEMMDRDGLRTGGAFAQMVANVLPSYQLGESEYGSDRYQIIQDLAGNIFSGYTGATNNGFQANNLYNITYSTWYEAMFNDVFVRVIGSWTDLNDLREDFPETVALADILKVAALQRVTDTYGPIPYSKLASGSLEVAYDSQENVYKAMFKELGDAIDLLTVFYQGNGSATLLADYDNVFYGNVQKWIQFANTLRLRMALRVVYADEALFQEQAAAAIANAVGFLESDASLHPGTGAWQYPLYTIQYDFNEGDSYIGATIESIMNGYEDPRRAAYFTTASDGAYHGVRGGITDGSNYKNKASRVACSKDTPLMWMAAAESYFLRAEYYLRIGDEDSAKALYESGIAASFSAAGASGADAYIANSDRTPAAYTDFVSSHSYNGHSDCPIAWDAAYDFEGHLEQIITQKYIACFPEGQEAWTEFRRTGYPSVIPFERNNSGGTINTTLQIRRLPYPSGEYRTNNTNVNQAVTTLTGEASNQGADNAGTRLWWDKNPRF